MTPSYLGNHMLHHSSLRHFIQYMGETYTKAGYKSQRNNKSSTATFDIQFAE